MNLISLRANASALVAALTLTGLLAPASAQIAVTDQGILGGSIYTNDFFGGSTYSQLVIGPHNLSDATHQFQAYCIDPFTGYQWGQSVYSTTSLSNFLNTKLSDGNTGYQQQFASYGTGVTGYALQSATTVMNNLTSLYSHAYTDGMASALKQTAFAYVVWEIMGDTIAANSRVSGAARSSGTDAVSNAVGSGLRDALETQIDAYMAALSSNSWTSVNGANLTATTNYTYTVYYDAAPHTAQNFLTVSPATGGGTGGTVPEPGSLVLAGLGLAGLLRLKQRQAAH